MNRFNRKGMLIIPSPHEKTTEKPPEKILVKECFCHNGHQLISKRVMFDCYEGIFLKAKNKGKEGFIGLNPIYGEKCRISLDLELVSGEVYQLICPVCNENLPVFSTCSCGAKIIALFLNNKADFSDCIGICSRVNCNNSAVQSRGELLSLTMVNSSGKKSGLGCIQRQS